ncbi:MAG: Uma2 family endonuclease [Armatimonadetes bacterium]|nr:Uma2 family endonuclease [Armatimonadota bacterium]
MAKPDTIGPTAPPTGLISFEQFLEMDGENHHVEWVAGRVVEMPPITNEHDRLVGYLRRLVGDVVEIRDLGRVVGEPFQMRCVPGGNSRAPDLVFIASDYLGRIQHQFLDGPGDLVIEVLSPSTRTIDRRDKLAEYQAGGVPEYWMLDPVRREADFRQLDAPGILQPVLPDADGVYHSRSLPDLHLPVAWLWEQPPVIGCLREWGLL